MSRAFVAPLLLPHGHCPPGCPYCPDRADVAHGVLPGPLEVAEAVDRARRRIKGGSGVELAFYGGDLWTLPAGARAVLLAAADAQVRRGRVDSIRVTLSAESVLRAPLADLRARGVRAVEVPLLTFDPGVLRRLSAHRRPGAGLAAIARLRQARLRSIAHLSPGLPGSSHRTAISSAEILCRVRPDAVRVLPALALEGTWGATHVQAGLWEPMSIDEAVATCKHVVRRLREAGTPVIRVGLQPAVDLQEAPEVLAGPYHPALRQRVESELLRGASSEALQAAFTLGVREFTFLVHPADESYLRGHENRSLQRLREQFRLGYLGVITSDAVPRGDPIALPNRPGPAEVARAVGCRKAS